MSIRKRNWEHVEYQGSAGRYSARLAICSAEHRCCSAHGSVTIRIRLGTGIERICSRLVANVLFR